VKYCITLLLLLASVSLLADYPLEIIEMKGRPVVEVIPIIKPFVGSEGSVAGMDNHLIIRTSPENLHEIRRILKQIDRPPRRLLISVRQGNTGAVEGRGISADIKALVGKQGQIAIGKPEGEEEIRLRGIGAGTRSDLDLSHRVQALEGRPAFISTGRSVPVNRSQIYGAGPFPYYGSHSGYRETATGFYALARLDGNQVTIEINPRMERTGNITDRFDIQQAHTMVSGPLGTWIAVGEVSRSGFRRNTGIGLNAGTRSAGQGSIYLKVDQIP